jgi:hypothetical protein
MHWFLRKRRRSLNWFVCRVQRTSFFLIWCHKIQKRRVKYNEKILTNSQ